MEMHTTISGRDADGVTVMSATLNDVQRDPGRCDDKWCLYFVSKGVSSGTRVLYTGKNTKAYGPQTIPSYTYFTLDGSFYVGCTGYSGSPGSYTPTGDAMTG